MFNFKDLHATTKMAPRIFELRSFLICMSTTNPMAAIYAIMAKTMNARVP